MRTSRNVSFTGSEGHVLSGLLSLPRSAPLGGLILCHCFTCSKDYKILTWMARCLAHDRWAVLRFDFAGLGSSQGDFARTTLSTDIADVVSAAGWLESQGYAVTALAGHSMGGTAAILAAARLPQVRSVAVIGTSWDVQGIRRILSDEHHSTIAREGQAIVPVVGRPHPISAEFLEDLKRHSLLDTVGSWDKRLLVLHGTADRTVSLAAAEKLFAAATQPKSFIALDGADHLFVKQAHAERAARLLALWLGADAPH